MFQCCLLSNLILYIILLTTQVTMIVNDRDFITDTSDASASRAISFPSLEAAVEYIEDLSLLESAKFTVDRTKTPNKDLFIDGDLSKGLASSEAYRRGRKRDGGDLFKKCFQRLYHCTRKSSENCKAGVEIFQRVNVTKWELDPLFYVKLNKKRHCHEGRHTRTHLDKKMKAWVELLLSLGESGPYILYPFVVSILAHL